MQIVSHKGNIVEKILRDKEGRLVRAKFYVYESAGRIRARLLEISVINQLKGKVLSLFSSVSQVKKLFKIFFQTVPFYFTTNTLAFSGNKPRAPTL